MKRGRSRIGDSAGAAAEAAIALAAAEVEDVLRAEDRAGAVDAASLAGSYFELPEIPHLRFYFLPISHQDKKGLVGPGILAGNRIHFLNRYGREARGKRLEFR